MADGEQHLAADRESSRVLEEARRRRVELHGALVNLEQEISSPARGRVPDWASDVAKALLMLQAAFDEHVATTEREGGLYDEILENSARLAGQVRRLREEHPMIRDAIAAEADRMSGPVPDDWPLDDVRDDLQRLMGLVVRHRQRGADLVWEAYNLDIGGAE
jgi:hypothetical protein